MLAYPAFNYPYAPNMQPSIPLPRPPIRERILAASPHQLVLIAALRETDYVSEAVNQTKKHIKNTQAEAEALKQIIAQRFLRTPAASRTSQVSCDYVRIQGYRAE